MPEANTRRPEWLRGRGPPESSGRGMRGKRYIEELGRWFIDSCRRDAWS